MKNENLWHEIRAKNVGGSEVAALFNVSPYMTHYKLWLLKKGLIQADDLSNNERVEAGNMLEPAIIDWFNKRYQTSFKHPFKYFTHPTISGMGCTPDGISTENSEHICQVKNVDSIVFGRGDKWKCEGDVITKAPLDIVLQCQHEMACTGAEKNTLIVLVGGNSLKYMAIERDDEAIGMIEQKVSQFWQAIEADDMPAPDFEKDGQNISMLRQLSKNEETDVDLTSNNILVDAVIKYTELQNKEKEISAEKDAAKATIMHHCVGIKSAKVRDFIVTFIDTAAQPDKEITQEMVGQKIKGRAASSYFKVKQQKEG